MRLDLTERLRCPRAHAPTPLVVVAGTTRDRELVRGVAGCPVCRLELPIRDGHLHCDDAGSAMPPDGAAPAGDPSGGMDRPERDDDAPPPELDRAIALLGLDSPEGAVLLTGRYAALAGPLSDATGIAVIVLGAPAPAATALVAGVVGAPPAVPFADATFRGAALDAQLPGALLADAPRTVAVGGRVLAHAAVPAMAGLTELARDDREWVAAREGSPALVRMTRAGEARGARETRGG